VANQPLTRGGTVTMLSEEKIMEILEAYDLVAR
jgi:hypothetical protein